nr:hypothetical protein [Tanacetum cinerariifolium]
NTATIGVSIASASVTTAGVSISIAEPRTPPTKTIKTFEDEDLTIAQTLVKKIKVNTSGSGEDSMVHHDDLTNFVPPTPHDSSLSGGHTLGSDEEEIQKLYEREQKWINDFVPMDSEVVKDSAKKDDSSQKQAESTRKRTTVEHDKESVKKQKLEGDTKKEELRACLDIIIRANGSFKNYKIFTKMCDDFDRRDVLDLYSLVKQRYETINPEGYDRLLWGDLITLFKPSEEDEIWKAQQDYILISWRLFDSCRVYVLLMDNGIAIHMMVERKYPLIQEMLSRMLNRRLEIDHESKMAFELIRFIKAQLEE